MKRRQVPLPVLIIRRGIRIVCVAINNAGVFLEAAITHLIPPWNWGILWRHLRDAHEEQIRADLWEMRLVGDVLEIDGLLYLAECSECGDRLDYETAYLFDDKLYCPDCYCGRGDDSWL